jgi:hypothetical protein
MSSLYVNEIISIIVAVVGQQQSTRFVNSLRALRALRPLRLVANFESTRTVLAALLGSFKTVSNVIVFGIVMFSVLAIIGVQNYSVTSLVHSLEKQRSLTWVLIWLSVRVVWHYVNAYLHLTTKILSH